MVKIKQLAKEVDNSIQMALDHTNADPSGALFGKRRMILHTIKKTHRQQISNKTAKRTTPISLQEIYKEKMRLNFSKQELIRKKKLWNIHD